MAGKIAWIFFGIAIICAIVAAFTSPFRLKWYQLPARPFPLHLDYLACSLHLKAGKKSNITKLRRLQNEYQSESCESIAFAGNIRFVFWELVSLF